jgi:single-strand DNA-binding protein
MNSCILMAEIIKNPELRYTSDNQMKIADMFVQFAPPFSNRPDEQHPTIEVVAWGELATEMKENYKQGDRVTIEGRLEMNTIERDGYKEKRARLVASHLYHITTVGSPAGASTPATAPVSATLRNTGSTPSQTNIPRTDAPPLFNDGDADDIPF